MRAIKHSELRNDLLQVLDDIVDKAEVIAIISEDDGATPVPRLYLVPAIIWEGMQETNFLLSGANRDHLMRSIRQLKAGPWQ